MTHKIKDVLKTLDQFQLKTGYENFHDEDAVSIFESENPFIIKKTEWKKALGWGMDMPPRAIGEWWTYFIDLGYLEPLKDKEPQAWLKISVIKRDIEDYYGSVSELTGAEQ